MSTLEPLTVDQASALLIQANEWHVLESHLAAEYRFADFLTAFAFITRVAAEAEARGHHPEWSNVYNRVTFKLQTHDAGNKITARDVQLALVISDIARAMTDAP